ncbi:MAG: DUF5011 domain-containing protein [Candidatus Latescibacteria bacterium]|nr:DUF5011 domain-containing protein [Candidatus Latescibacterota bacterium]
MSLDLVGFNSGGIRQTIGTVPGQTYNVTFDMAANPSGANPKTLRVSAGAGSALFSFDWTGKTGTNMGWQNKTWSFVAASTWTVLSFENTSSTLGNAGPALDNVRVVKSANRPPVANAGADQTVECTGPSGASVTLNGAGSSDPDGDTLTYSWSGPFGTVSGPTPTVTLPLGTHTITLTVNDGKGGTSSDTVQIKVQDTTPPTLAGVPADATVECDAVPAPATVTATDACDPAPTVTFSETRTDGSSPDNYTLTRKWTATDHSNNSVSATQTLTVQDTTKPVITLVGDNPVTVECPTPYVDLGVRVTDNCDPNPTLTTDNPVNVHAPGDYTITYTGKDRSGNTATLTRTVKVQDTTPPEAKASLAHVRGPKGADDDDEDSDENEGRDDDDGDSEGNFIKVSTSATDACDSRPAITSFITQPLTSSTGVVVKYKKGKKNSIEIKIGKKIEVKLEGPNEAALRSLLTQAIALGGFPATDGQVLKLVSTRRGRDDDDDDDGESGYQYGFDGTLRLTSAKGPGIKLVAFATDASGNRSTVVEVLPMKPKAKKGQALLAKVGEDAPAAPEAFGLDQSYPNPFNPSTTIRYGLPEASNVSLVVYNILGQQVRRLVSGAQGPGYHAAVWDGRDEAGRLAATGMYIYRLQAGAFVQVKKMLMAK